LQCGRCKYCVLRSYPPGCFTKGLFLSEPPANHVRMFLRYREFDFSTADGDAGNSCVRVFDLEFQTGLNRLLVIVKLNAAYGGAPAMVLC